MTQLELPLAEPTHPVEKEEEKRVQQALQKLGNPNLLVGYSVERNSYVQQERPFVDGFGPDIF